MNRTVFHSPQGSINLIPTTSYYYHGQWTGTKTLLEVDGFGPHHP